MWKNRLIIFIAIVIVLISGYKIYGILEEYVSGQKMYSDISEKYIMKTDKIISTDSETSDDTLKEDDQLDQFNYKSVKVDFDGLKRKNSETVGWIRFDDECINYPIMQSRDNSKYLNTGMDNNYNRCGSIFLDYLNSSDFSDYHTIIYGHNMKDGSMFGKLKKYRSDEGFLQNNQYFTIYTNTKALRYRVFAFYGVPADDSEVYVLGFSSDDKYQEFIDTISKRNNYSTEILPTKTDKIVTLSTCSGEDSRWIVNAYLIEEYTY